MSESIGDGREIAKSEEITIGVGESYVLEGEITSEDTEELESGDYQVVGYITINRDLYDDVKTDLTIEKVVFS